MTFAEFKMQPDITERYRELDLPPSAELAAVREAYHQLVKVWHPDRFGHDLKLQAIANDKLKRINSAYESIVAYLASAPPLSKPEPPKTTSQSRDRNTPTAEEIYRLGLDRYYLRDYKNALDFFLRAAEMGNASAQYAVGFVYYQHTTRNAFTLHKQHKNDNAAFAWWTQAAEQGHSSAQYMLGIFYLYAYSTPYNEGEARKWFQCAASKGHLDAKQRLSKMGYLHKIRAIPLVALVMEAPPSAPLPT